MEKVLVIFFKSSDSKTCKTICLSLRFRIDRRELGFMINGVLDQIPTNEAKQKITQQGVTSGAMG